MKLKELESILRGSLTFKIEYRNSKSKEIEIYDGNLHIFELKYLPKHILNKTVLRLDLDDKSIFLS